MNFTITLLFEVILGLLLLNWIRKSKKRMVIAVILLVIYVVLFKIMRM